MTTEPEMRAAREGWCVPDRRLLPAFVDLLAATGGRPNEVLALRWSDVDLSADPSTVTINATLIDHGRIAGMPLHRQDARKGDAPRTLWCCRGLGSMR
jgi:integrase